jgi:hypothetical protein
MFKSHVFGIRTVPFFDGPNAAGELPNLDSLDDVEFLAEGEDDANSKSDDEVDDDTDDTPDGDREEDSKGEEDSDGEESEEDSEESEEDEESDEEDEESEEEETDEKPEVVGADGKISVKALKEKYPNIFKEVPGLKDVIYREREYSKLGPIDDVRESLAKAETFDNFESTLMQGGIGELLDAVAESNEEAAVTIAENFLPELYNRSKPLFAKVTMPVIKNVIRSTFVRANNTGNKQLALAVQYVSRELFETPDVLKATEIVEEQPDPREEQIKLERAKLHNTQITTARTDIVNGVTGRLRREILPKLDESMSEFVKDALTEKIINELNSTLRQDKAHMANLSSLWKKMSKTGYTNEAKSRIISASLARAKQVLPSVISRVKAKQAGKKTGDKKLVKKAGEKQIPNQKSSNLNRGRQNGKLSRNVSDFDFISQP